MPKAKPAPTPRPAIRAGLAPGKHEQAQAAPGVGLLPPEKGFILDARRISAIHERQLELAVDIPETRVKLAALEQEAERLYKENHELRDAICVAAGPDGWKESLVAAATVENLRRR